MPGVICNWWEFEWSLRTALLVMTLALLVTLVFDLQHERFEPHNDIK
jgi:hypothetical protein